MFSAGSGLLSPRKNRFTALILPSQSYGRDGLEGGNRVECRRATFKKAPATTMKP